MKVKDDKRRKSFDCQGKGKESKKKSSKLSLMISIKNRKLEYSQYYVSLLFILILYSRVSFLNFALCISSTILEQRSKYNYSKETR